MGTSHKRLGKTRNIKYLEKIRFSLQQSIDMKKEIDERRKMGQFSTSYSLANEIMEYGLSLIHSDEITFLEPAFGTGVFYSALLYKSDLIEKHIKGAMGIEIDLEYFNIAYSVWKESEICLLNADFTKIEPTNKYNFIITNPPYVRHHYISKELKKKLMNQVKEEIGLEISGLSGLYCYFLLLTHKWLAPGAICGWLLPSEFMDVNYGSVIKEYLLNKVHLLRIHRYDPEILQFDEALVSSCVVWFKNEIINDDYVVKFSYSGTHEEPKCSKLIRKSELLSECKWTRFPEKSVRYNENTVTLGDFFTIKRGLATGDNNFFILSKEQIADLGLELSFFKPILPSPRYLKTDFVETDSQGYPKLDPQFFLLDCELTEDEIQIKYPDLWTYLESGENTTGKKYLCKNRKKWYWQEQRQPTKFLCSYMGRGNHESAPIRFILNLSEAVATNSYLMLYPKDTLQEIILYNPNVIFQVWEILKDITANDIEEEGRVYGGGLKKIEPKELSKVHCDKLAVLCLENEIEKKE